ncbi:MAG: CAP domain-containing protein [Alphaproteobacteria bacterium]|nr:CAP domain-containing protein [Alphaproteobacteria bacterium]
MRPSLLAALLATTILVAGGPVRANDGTDDVLAALNRARTDPAGFAGILQAYRARMRGDRYFEPRANTWIVTQEGVAAIDEAIAVLRATAPLPPVVRHTGLTQAAQDQVAWQGPRGEVGHAGEGRSTPFDRMRRRGVVYRTAGENISYGPTGLQVVVDLIVDDGVPGRGHRHNILDPSYREVGIALGPHRRYGTMCVMDFAATR